jgi:dCMP deaminase
MDTRPNWDEYFLDIAEKVSSRSTCLRLKVGSVLVAEDNRILATGYNGSPKGTPHCIDAGCLKNEEGRCIRTIHSEINAILSVDMHVRKNSILYCTHEPCENCTKSIIQAGIKKVVFKNAYPNPNSANHYFSPYLEWVHYKKD